jgi:hypothetical protein
VELVAQALSRTGIVPGFGHDFAAVGVDVAAIRAASLRQFGDLAAAAQVPVLMLDPEDFFPPDMLADLPPAQQALIHPIGKEPWDAAVTRPAASLPPDERLVPHDDHFGPGTHRLFAVLLARELRRLGVVN